MTMPQIFSGGTQGDRLDKLAQFVKLAKVPARNVLFSTDGEEGIGEIRKFQHWLSINATSGNKVLVLKNAQDFSTEAQNAMLKTLEESGENTIILETSNADLLLPTITSRCVIHYLNENAIDPDPKLIEGLNNLSNDLGSRFLFAQQNSKTREEAIEFVDNCIVALRGKLRDNSNTSNDLESLFFAKKCLFANANVRLTIENLFLNW